MIKSGDEAEVLFNRRAKKSGLRKVLRVSQPKTNLMNKLSPVAEEANTRTSGIA